MNRLVIIGNGFDLAHGLPTKYSDFIDDLWCDIIENCSKYSELVHLDNINFNITPIKKNINFKTLVTNIKDYCKDSANKYSQLTWNIDELHFFAIRIDELSIREILYFKNEFFKAITSKQLENWVDIESEYYYQLKKIVKSSCLDISKSEEYWQEEQKNQVKKLNDEFEQIKSLLKKYLSEKVVDKYSFKSINDQFHNIFYPDILDELKIDTWKADFSKEDKEYIEELVKEGKVKTVKLRFLNFNYTPTLSIYYHMNRGLYSDAEYFIHGKLNAPDNEINFGFGDEMDDEYKMIENINEKEYLKNFKSFKYLLNDTYKKLLDFIEGDKFEVLIIGSSCGLSDRTLLNTIFENKNCCLIKVYYYQWFDDETQETKDNFTELTQNISRHFNDKKLMRSKIVHKKPEYIIPMVNLSKNEF